MRAMNRNLMGGGSQLTNLMESLERRTLLSGSAGPMAPVSDDRFEPNDSIRVVEQMDEGSENCPNLGAVEGETVLKTLRLVDRRDVFRFVLNDAAGEGDLVRILFDNKRGNLDLRLLNSDGEVLMQSISKKNKETIRLDGLAAGEYFAQVIGRSQATNSNYRLVLNIAPKVHDDNTDDGSDDNGGDNDANPIPPGGLMPPEDLWEAGNDSIDEVRQATEGGVYSPNFGAIGESRSMMEFKLSDSADFYRVVLADGVGPHACVRITASDGLNLALFNSAGEPIRFADAYMGQDTVSFEGLAGGEYFIRVTHYALDNPTNVDYGLIFNFPS